MAPAGGDLDAADSLQLGEVALERFRPGHQQLVVFAAAEGELEVGRRVHGHERRLDHGLDPGGGRQLERVLEEAVGEVDDGVRVLAQAPAELEAGLRPPEQPVRVCLLYTSDAADE